MPSNNNSNDLVLPLFDNRQQQTQRPSKRGRNCGVHAAWAGGGARVIADTVDFGTLGGGETGNSSSHGGYSGSGSIPVPSEASPASSASSSSHHKAMTPMIDNRQLVYIPIRLACGVCVRCSPEVLSTDPGVLRSLQADLTRAFRVLPPAVHGLVRRTNLWVNATYAYGDRADPQIMRHLTTHHEGGWLVRCARDVPQKARGIEIYSCADFQRMRLHWNGSGLLLHELCHLIHQLCLDGGLDNAAVSDLYQQAHASGRYERVLRRDWAGMPEDYDMAYAMVDKKEFFAEMSVAFLSNGYHALDRADCSVMECCNPPLLHPTVTDRVLQQHGISNSGGGATDQRYIEVSAGPSCWTSPWGAFRPHSKPKVRMVDPVFQEAAMSRNCINVPHCNKFYPFTRGQLQHYDKDLFRGVQALWREISMWDDPKANSRSCLCAPR